MEDSIMRKATAWNLHILAGVALVILLGTHMITTHLDLILGWFNPAGGEAIDWKNVTARGAEISWSIFYVFFLGIALYHGLYGLRTILFELSLNRGAEKAVTAILVTVGIGLFIIGTVAAITFKSVAMGA
jgi:succinate dehydrogenase hydrophobic anchor subunit